MPLSVGFSTPMTLAVPQAGMGPFSDTLLALANGRVIDVLSIAKVTGSTDSPSEKLVSLDARDPRRTATTTVPGIGAISANQLISGSTLREFYGQSGTLVMRTDGVTGATFTPVVIGPAHPGKAVYGGSFHVNYGAFGLDQGGLVVA